jgi:hypothetical protein
MSRSITCECGRLLPGEFHKAGQNVSCPSCGREVQIPTLPAAPLAPATSGEAIACFLLAVLSLGTWPFTTLLALVAAILSLACGVLGTRDIRREPGQLKGRWLVRGSVAADLLGILLGMLVLPGVQRIRETANRMTDF